jgi:hypothetical protein
MPSVRRERRIPTTIRLPESVYYELRTLMCNPRTGAIRYATWGALFETLAREHLERRKIARSVTAEEPMSDG